MPQTRAIEFLQNLRIGGLFDESLQGIDHDVADPEDGARIDALRQQMVVAVVAGGEQQIGQHIGFHAVDFFGHAEIEAAFTGFHMG